MNREDVIVIGLHSKRNAPVESEEMGNCLICGNPVFLAKYGVDGELIITEMKKLKLKRLMGMDCVVEIVAAFKKVLEQPQDIRQATINKLLKKEKLS